MLQGLTIITQIHSYAVDTIIMKIRKFHIQIIFSGRVGSENNCFKNKKNEHRIDKVLLNLNVTYKISFQL